MPGDQHVIVADLGFGDAGKGSTVDWLCSPAVGAAGGEQRTGRTSPYRAVIRFNGGAQAAHNVEAPDGRHHTFAQFGSGTLHGVPTFLSRFMMVEPFGLAAEAEHLASLGVPDPFGLLSIDRRALLTTPYHRAANRAREAARDRTPGGARHGSCGLGIGETAAYALAVPPDEAPRVGDCTDRASLVRKLAALRDRLIADLELAGISWDSSDGGKVPSVDLCAEVYEAFGAQARIVDEPHLARLLESGPCVFEGAQGVLIDEWYGFHPHTTWSTTTFANAVELMADAGDTSGAMRLGVVRTFTTRHGAGPFVTEDPSLTDLLPEMHNGTGAWQGTFRFGHFDAVAHRYAVDVCGGPDAVNGLVVTHADLVPPELRMCRAYRTPDETELSALTPSRAPDLDYQRMLTKTVSSAAPVLSDGPADPRDWPEAIADELGVPLAVVSHGPTWLRKSQVPNVLR